MRRFYLFLWVLIFVSSRDCGAYEIFDIETLPSFRSKQYSLEPYKKVIVFSASRTGSSLVYNVLRFVFESEGNLFCSHNEFNQRCSVLKTHKFSDLNLLEEKNVLYVITVRNPVDAIISNYRICPCVIVNIREFVEELICRHKECLLFAESMQNEGHNVVFIKYEEFEDNLDFIFNFIEDRFLIELADLDKILMSQGYAKENIYFSTKGFSDFKQYLPVSGFHGKHVTLEKYTPPAELLYWLNLYLPDIAPAFKKYGYF